MFLGIPVIQDGIDYNVSVNVMHIISLEYVNPRNVDAGTLIFLRDGRAWESTLTIDVIQTRINKTVERYGNQILVSYVAEQLPEPKKRKSTSKTVKY
jgi:hypothetical protein